MKRLTICWRVGSHILVTSEDMSHRLLSSSKHQSNPEVAMQSVSQRSTHSLHFAPWCQHYILCSTSQGNWILLLYPLLEQVCHGQQELEFTVLNWRWQGQQRWGDVRKYLWGFERKQFEKDKSLAKSWIGKEDYENSRSVKLALEWSQRWEKWNNNTPPKF